jgi:hypothetical protein
LISTLGHYFAYRHRFLIIDEKENYHFGASFKDLGKKTFMLSRFAELTIQSAILSDYDSNWSQGTVLFP